MVETTDLIFAVDSIPAIFAITADPFLVFTQQRVRDPRPALAVLRAGWRAARAALHEARLCAAVLLVVGVKMLAHEPIKEALGENFNLYLLGVVLTILAIGVVASLLHSTGKRDVAHLVCQGRRSEVHEIDLTRRAGDLDVVRGRPLRDAVVGAQDLGKLPLAPCGGVRRPRGVPARTAARAWTPSRAAPRSIQRTARSACTPRPGRRCLR
jgi:hypothetical protein